MHGVRVYDAGQREEKSEIEEEDWKKVEVREDLLALVHGMYAVDAGYIQLLTAQEHGRVGVV